MSQAVWVCVEHVCEIITVDVFLHKMFLCFLRTFVSNLLFLFFIPAASSRISTMWKCTSTTIWTSFAPTTPTAKCHRTQLSATCSTWWRKKTTTCANRTLLTSCDGSAHGHSLLMYLRSSLRNFSVILPLPWEKNSDKGKAITISVSIKNTGLFCRLVDF